MHRTPAVHRWLQTRILFLLLAVVFGAAYAVPAAQTAPAQAGAKKALTIEDYTRWRSIGSSDLSDDGKWAVYVLSLTNVAQSATKPVLHLRNLETQTEVEVADATGPTFSSDSKWLAYTIDPAGGGRGGRGGRGGGGGDATAGVDGQAPQTPAGGRGAQTPPQPRRVELRNLETGAIAGTWQDIQSFSFSPTATHLALRRRPANTGGGGGRGAGGGETATPPGGGGGGGGQAAETPSGPRGVDVTVRDLRTGRDQLLGDVGDYAFNKAGDALAYTVDAAVKDANGLFVLDLPSGRTVPLENDAKLYNDLTWNDRGTALAVLKGLDVDKMRERNNVLVVYPNVKAAMTTAGSPPVVLDPAKATGFPKDWVVSDRSSLSWSDDDTRVFFGIKAQVANPGTQRRNADEVADVDVWNSRDERIQSVQMNRANADRNFTYRSAFVAGTGAFVRLTDETMRDIDIAPTGRWAVGRDARAYVSDYEPDRADLYRVDTMTGDRTLMMKGQLTGSGTLGISPDGRTYLFWKDDKFQAYDFETAASKTLGGNASVSFVNTEYDHPGPKPSYGVAGYTPDGKAVIVQHRYDLWSLPLDGSAAANVTGGYGSKNEIRLRVVRTAPLDPMADYPGGAAAERQRIDLSKPVTLSAYGEWTKKAGFFELSGGQLREIVYDDASFSTPSRAGKAEKYLFTRQTFVEYPDLRVSGPDFKTSTKITDANPQQNEFLWGHRILFDYKNKKGVRLQGILAIPDDYKAGEKRPMLVTFYEKNSQNLHRYNAPSYLTGMGSSPMQAVTEGYLTMLADVYFNTGSSHSDMLDCVEAAVKKVIEMGYADPKRIGVNGHSYGGEGAAFIGTRSKLFAAVGVGAGVSDLYSDFNQSWGWTYQVTGGSGANGHDYYLYGQGRWGFTPWDQPEVYRFESAITHVQETIAPFLIMHGTADPTVSFTEGMNLYNALRYAKKTAVLLAYPGEGHGLRGLGNRKDLTIRYFQFFNHYLKDAPAPKWLTDGIPFIEKDANRDPGK